MGIKKNLLTGLALLLASGCASNITNVPLSDAATYKPRPYDVLPEETKKETKKTTKIKGKELHNILVKDPVNNHQIGMDYFETKANGTRKRNVFGLLTYPIENIGFIQANGSLLDADYYKKLKPGTSTTEKNIDLSVLFEAKGKEPKQEGRTFKPIGIYLGPKGEFSEVDYPNKTNPRGYESKILGGIELFISLNETQIDFNALAGNGRIEYIDGRTGKIYDSNKINLSSSHLLSKDLDLELKTDITHEEHRTVGIKSNFDYKERQISNEFTAGLSKGIKVGEEAKLFLGADFFSKRAVVAEKSGDKTLCLSSNGTTIYTKYKAPAKMGELELAIGYSYEQGSKAYEIWGKRTNSSYNIIAILRW